MRKIFVVLCVVFVGMFIAGCSLENQEKIDNQEMIPPSRIALGLPTSSFPETGAIINALGITIGSGVLITPDVILTCEHVFRTPVLNIPPFRFVVNKTVSRKITKRYTVSGSVEIDSVDDLTVCVLSSSISVSPARIKRSGIPVGDTARIVGYGIAQSLPGEKTFGITQVTEARYNYIKLSSPLLQSGLSGDSGGGVYDNNGYLVGIMYGGNKIPDTWAHTLCDNAINEINKILYDAYAANELTGKETLNVDQSEQIDFLGDIDGNGKSDLILQQNDGSSRNWHVWASTGGSFYDRGDWTYTSTPDVNVVGVADVNYDGKADLVLQYDLGGVRRWQARVSNGSAFIYNGDWTTTGTPGVNCIGVADVNADGKADLVLQYDWNGLRYWQARISNGSAFVWNGDWTSTSTPEVNGVGVADVNADGKADLVLQYDWNGLRYWQARISNGSAFVWNGDWTSTNTPGVNGVGVADMNRDGKADLVLQYFWNGQLHWQIRTSNGSSFTSGNNWLSIP